MSEVIGPQPQIAPKKHCEPPRWQSGRRRRLKTDRAMVRNSEYERNKGLDGALDRFASRPLEEACPYLILDARYEKVRIDGVIRSQAVQIAIGINWEGRRQILGVELANRESTSNWNTFVQRLKSGAWPALNSPSATATRD